MRAAFYREFEGPIEILDLPDPEPADDGVVLAVEATGLCRSDWHGWMGHDPDITLPHVPGHEVAGTIVAVGSGVERWNVGDRVTVPFVAGCGRCDACRSGNEQVCEYQFQPGFTAWGTFAEFVALRYADRNLVRVPPEIPSTTAAILGCRFGTAFRAVVDRGRVAAGMRVVVHGCGGVGLAAVMIAAAFDARVVAVDTDPAALVLAEDVGAERTILAADASSTLAAVREATAGGPTLSVDAIGHPDVVATSIASLARSGRHVQIGLIPADTIPVPMAAVIARELEILGSHGIQAWRYPAMLDMIVSGSLDPGRLITRRIPLSRIPVDLPAMGTGHAPGITVVDRLDR
jgi:alcohol dehydrogenase